LSEEGAHTRTIAYILVALGTAAVSGGFFMAWPPLGFIVGGLCVAAFAIVFLMPTSGGET